MPKRSSIVQTMRALAAAGLCLLAVPGSLPAADPPQIPDLFGQADDGFPGPAIGPAAEIKLVRNGGGEPTATLQVTVRVPPGSYTYSTNPGFGAATKITVSKLQGLKSASGKFTPDRPPKKVFEKLLKQEVEKYHSDVTWSRKYVIEPGAKPETVRISGKVAFQICDDNACRPKQQAFDLTLADAGKPQNGAPAGTVAGKKTGRQQPAADGSTTAKRYSKSMRPQARHSKKPEPVTLKFAISPVDARQGEAVTLSVTVELDPQWHVFDMTQDPDNSGLPTKIAIKKIDGLAAIGSSFRPSKPPQTELTFDKKEQKVHYHEITWTKQYKVTAETRGKYGLAGTIRYQVCKESQCRPPRPIWIALGTLADEQPPARPPKSSTPVLKTPETTAGAKPKLDLGKIKVESSGDYPLPTALLIAFAAGIILNFMPCVLPVIGLKLMAFVQQAGDSRGQILALNLWFSAGLMFVFLVLASGAVLPQVLLEKPGLSWGEQFSSVTFTVTLASIVFVFALSFLGVWEIPIPGFASSKTANQMADREGATGAFSKGILTTVLATPCSGPLLVPAIAWAVKQPLPVAYAGFACVGLGMASPYLLIGAFPQLIRFLPKPGAWMETLKNILGFVLLGTMVFLLSFIEIPYVVPTVAFAIGLWAACWWIGRVPLTAPRGKRLSAWLAAAVFAGVMGFVSFDWLHGVMDSRFNDAVAANTGISKKTEGNELPWQPYTQKLLEQFVARGKTVFIDFTADW